MLHSADMFQLNICLLITVFLNTAIPRRSVFCCTEAYREQTNSLESPLTLQLCVLLLEDSQKQLYHCVTPKIAHTIQNYTKDELFSCHLEDWLATHSHTAHSGDTKGLCAHSKGYFFLFFFCFFIQADYIHKSCFHFSGGKKMLLLKPISWSYCA